MKYLNSILLILMASQAAWAVDVECSIMKSDFDPATNDYVFIYQETFSLEPSLVGTDAQAVSVGDQRSVVFSVNYSTEGIVRVKAQLIDTSAYGGLLNAGFATSPVDHILDNSIEPPTHPKAHVNLMNVRLLNGINRQGMDLYPREDEVLAANPDLPKNEILKASVSCEVK